MSLLSVPSVEALAVSSGKVLLDSSLDKLPKAFHLSNVRLNRFSAAVNSVSGEKVAIKKIGNAFDNIIDAKRALREIKLLRHMDHENVSLITIILHIHFLQGREKQRILCFLCFFSLFKIRS